MSLYNKYCVYNYLLICIDFTGRLGLLDVAETRLGPGFSLSVSFPYSICKEVPDGFGDSS